MKKYLLQALLIGFLASTASASQPSDSDYILTWLDKQKISSGLASATEVKAKRFKTIFLDVCNKFINREHSPAAKALKYKKALEFVINENYVDQFSNDQRFQNFPQDYSELQEKIALSLFPTNSFQAKVPLTYAYPGTYWGAIVQVQSPEKIESFMNQRCSETSIEPSAKLFVSGTDPVSLKLVESYDAETQQRLRCNNRVIECDYKDEIKDGDRFEVYLKTINNSL